MKRFSWRLQRLLEVTRIREDALRAELSALAGRIAPLRMEIVQRRSALRAMAADLARHPFDRRLERQETFMRHCVVDEAKIERLERQASDLEQKRKATFEQFKKVRSSRQALEKLREAARVRHVKEQDLLEQKNLDEVAQRRATGAHKALTG